MAPPIRDFFTARSLDFLFITETWLSNGDLTPFSELLPPKCKYRNSPRPGKRGGGLATIFKDCFQCRTIQRTAYNSFELQLLTLDSNYPIAVAVVYRPPKPHKDFLSDFADFLGGIMSNFERFLIMGILIFIYVAPKIHLSKTL